MIENTNAGALSARPQVFGNASLKKSLIAATALSMFSGVAHADDSNITVYGLLNVGVAHATNTIAGAGASVTAMNDSAASTSRWGIRGKEDMGGGMSALFDLESQLQSPSGVAGAPSNSGVVTATSSLFSRGAYFGVQGADGKVTFGRNYTAGFFGAINSNSIVTGLNSNFVASTFAMGLTRDYWNNNEIKYESPVVNGLSVQAAYSLAGTAGSNAGNNIGLNLDYKAAGFQVTLGGQRDNDTLSASGVNSGNTVTWYDATMSYTANSFRLSAGALRIKDPAGSTVATTNPSTGGYQTNYGGWVDSNMYTLGGSYRVTPQLALALQYTAVKENAGGTTTKQAIFNVDYALSKRTSLYALFGHVNNGNLVVAPLFSLSGSPSGLQNQSSSGLSLGVQHTF